MKTEPAVELLPLTLEQLDRLAVGDLAAAGRSLGMAVPPDFADGQWIWQHFATLTRNEPEEAWWRSQYLIVKDARIVGHARLHGPPDDRSEVAVGYHVDPIARGRGYAKAATKELITTARGCSAVKSLTALISETNAASIGVATSVGFVADGMQRHRFGWLMRRFVLPLRE